MSALRSLSSCVVFAVTVTACQWEVHDYGHDRASDDSAASSAIPSTTTPASSAAAAAAACDAHVDRWKELMVIHQSVLLDHRAQNVGEDGDVAGPWSFRARLEDLAGASSGGDASLLAEDWLTEWATVSSIGVDRAPVTPRPRVRDVLIDPWTSRALSATPFRLIAIANRPDLRENVAGCDGKAGELRFVYTAVNPTTRVAIPMTVIVEIPYPSTRTARGWIDVWHALAQKPFGAEYNDALAALTTEVTTNAPASTWRVRSNEIAFAPASGTDDSNASWELREFALKGSPAKLTQQLLQATPRIELDNSASLASWAIDNRSSVMKGSFVLPPTFQAAAAPVPTSWFEWSRTSGAMPEDVRHALSISTCNGCHGGERSLVEVLPFQQIAAPDQPTAYYGSASDGETRLSSYLNNPSKGSDDELGRREQSVAAALCAPAAAACGPVTTRY